MVVPVALCCIPDVSTVRRQSREETNRQRNGKIEVERSRRIIRLPVPILDFLERDVHRFEELVNSRRRRVLARRFSML
jgi:hypothetical protein